MSIWDDVKGAVSDVTDTLTGKNNSQITPPSLNGNSYQWGGHAGGAQDDVNRYRGLAGQADQRQGAQIRTGSFTDDRNMDLQSRNAQQQGLANYQGVINGTAPSVAQQQMQRGIQASQAAAASQAAGARGGGAGLAAAQRNAQTMGAQLGAQGNEQAAMLRAQEVSNAMGGYANQANSLRGADQARANQAAQMAQAQAGLEQQQHALNDTRNMGYEQLGYNVNTQQYQGQQAQEGAQAGLNMQGQTANAGITGQNAQGAQGLLGGVIGTGGSVLGSALAGGKSDERVKTGIEPLSTGASGAATGLGKGTDAVFGTEGGLGFGTRGGIGGIGAANAANSAGIHAAGLGGIAEGATEGNLGKRLDIAAHPGFGNKIQIGAASPLGDENNAKQYAVSRYIGSGDPYYGKVAFGDAPVYANNAGGGSSLMGGRTGSDSGPMGLASQGVISDEHSKAAIESLEKEKAQLWARLPAKEQEAYVKDRVRSNDATIKAERNMRIDRADPQAEDAAFAQRAAESDRAWRNERIARRMPGRAFTDEELRALPQEPVYQAPPREMVAFQREPAPAPTGLRGMLPQSSQLVASVPPVKSDAHSKARIQDLETQLATRDSQPAGINGIGSWLGAQSRKNQSPGFKGNKAMTPPLGVDPAMGSTESQFYPKVESDERAKTGEANAEPAKFMDKLKPYAFNYKDGVPGEDPDHRYYGVMAQDVRKTPMGASIVQDTPQGLQLDVQHGFGTALAGLANLNSRMRKLEGKRRG